MEDRKLFIERDYEEQTTEEFLRSFGVHSIDELPVLDADQLETFKREAEEEMQMKMDI